MGLSAFNAMRARMKAEAKALDSGAKVEVKEYIPVETNVVEENSITEKKTDAEKLKSKKKKES